ncbi:MAG: DUF2752 domain-containing protein [Saprospiraceae bacterium]|nr:DUF2752 domain-containing protein [Saprospiraceae bacterium]
MKAFKRKGWHWLLLLLGAWVIINLILGGSILWKCPFLAITGFKCSGCGGQRAILELFQGHFKNALYYNALLPFILMYALIYVLKYRKVAMFEKWWTILTSKVAIGIVIILTLTFTVIRNTSLWPWY